MDGAQKQEIEVKVAVPDVAAIRATLKSAGFVEFQPRSLEVNRIYDWPTGALRARGELIRIRQYAGQRILTYKGPATVGRHKEREEIEIDVSDSELLAVILQKLGLVPRFRYEKFRSEWARDGEDGVIMLDETPIGTYMELEGPADWIDNTAQVLGYRDADYINLSYSRLHVAYCAQRGEQAGDMVFPPSVQE